MPDPSNGYEGVADRFASIRSRAVGVATVREWSRSLPRGSSILDLGCGNGVPIAEALIEDGYSVHGVDAAPSLVEAFRRRFPGAPVECAAVEESRFFDRTFDAVIAWGLLFLLSPEAQAHVIRKASRALNAGGRFLFTAPAEAATWPDALTGHASISLGADTYHELLRGEGLALYGRATDEGENHYYFAKKDDDRRSAVPPAGP